LAGNWLHQTYELYAKTGAMFEKVFLFVDRKFPYRGYFSTTLELLEMLFPVEEANIRFKPVLAGPTELCWTCCENMDTSLTMTRPF